MSQTWKLFLYFTALKQLIYIKFIIIYSVFNNVVPTFTSYLTKKIVIQAQISTAPDIMKRSRQ